MLKYLTTSIKATITHLLPICLLFAVCVGYGANTAHAISPVEWNRSLLPIGNSMAGQAFFGRYIGDGVNGRAISGIGFSPLAVAVHHEEGGFGYFFFRNAAMVGDGMVGSGGSHAFMIQSLDSSGFTVGNSALVNSANRNGEHYNWIAWQEVTGFGNIEFAQGSYVGNGLASQDIICGFSPGAVWCGAKTYGLYQWRSSHFSTNQSFAWWSTGSWTPNAIISGGASGFTVGSLLNASGTTYHWCAWKQSKYFCAVGAYTGNSVDNRLIQHSPTVRFSPSLITTDCLQAKVNSSATWHNNAYSPGDATWTIRSGSPGVFSDMIQANDPTGFYIGTDTFVNLLNESYFYTSYGAGTLVSPPAYPLYGPSGLPVVPVAGACSQAADLIYSKRVG